MYSIQINNIKKHYKNGIHVLNNLSLSVKKGEIFSLLGQNGAGKSTLIRILTTYLKPTNGTVIILDKDILKETAFIRSQISCVSQQNSIDTHLSLEENMMFQSKLYKIPKNEAKKRMEYLLDIFCLKQYSKFPISSYSGGTKRKLEIAMNMMPNPKILFLDEPTIGMDIQSKNLMWKTIQKIRNDFETTIFLTTHYLDEADNISDTICIIQDGKEIIQDTPLKLKSYIKQNIIQISFSSNNIANKYLTNFSQQCPNNYIQLHNNTVKINTKNIQNDLIKINRFIIKNKIPFIGIEIVQPTLEDVFLHMIKK